MSERLFYNNLTLENLNNEEWRDILGYDGVFQVSNMGRIKSLKRYSTSGHLLKEYIKKQHLNSWRQLCVSLRYPGAKKGKTILVSTLVGEAFIGLRRIEEVFCHANKDSTDNRLSNLIKLSRSESEEIDYQQKVKCGTNKFKIHNVNLNPTKNNISGKFKNMYVYKSVNGVFSWKQLVEKYGKRRALNIYNSTKNGSRPLGFLWTKEVIN